MIILRLLTFVFLSLIALTLNAQDLHQAACQGDLPQLKSLLESGEDINRRDEKGNTPLQKAVSCDQKMAVEFLLEHKADVNIPDNSGRTPLYSAAHRNRADLLSLLLAHKADSNRGDKSGMYAIHKIILNENLVGVEQLVQSGADVNVKSHRGNLPLDLAIREGYDAIAQILTQKGAAKKEDPVQFGGKHIDEELPGLEAKMFAFNFISTENKTQNAIFHPNGKEFYFTVETFGNPGLIKVSRLENNQWSKPIAADIPGDYREVDPFITADGKKLFFCWDKPVVDGDSKERNMDLWMMERAGESWGTPTHLGPAVNTDEHDWFPTVSEAGTLYYSTGRFPQSNIYYSKLEDGKYQTAHLLGDSINTEHRDFGPYIAADESYLIFSSDRPGGVGNSDLHISFRSEDGSWSKAKNMGAKVNSTKAEFGPSLSPDKKFLFFTSWREGTASDVYWVDSKVIESLRD